MDDKTYLGDGLYVEFDGFMFILSAPREGGEHSVALEPSILDAFLKFIEKTNNVTIKVEKRS